MNEQGSTYVELYELMGNLYLAGMSIDGVIKQGYEFMLAEGMRTRAEMLHAARAVHAVAEELGISVEQQQAQAEQSSPYIRREEG